MTKDNEMLALSERLLQLANDEGTAQIHDLALEIRRVAEASAPLRDRVPTREQLLEALKPFAEIGLDVLKNKAGWANSVFWGQWCGYRLTYTQFERAAATALAIAQTPAAATKEDETRETISTLLDLLNPLHGSLDRQTYDEKVAENFDAPRDREYSVNVTAQQERDLTQAVRILENRRAALAADR
jgi:hypothetical protein